MESSNKLSADKFRLMNENRLISFIEALLKKYGWVTDKRGILAKDDLVRFLYARASEEGKNWKTDPEVNSELDELTYLIDVISSQRSRYIQKDAQEAVESIM